MKYFIIDVVIKNHLKYIIFNTVFFPLFLYLIPMVLLNDPDFILSYIPFNLGFLLLVILWLVLSIFGWFGFIFVITLLFAALGYFFSIVTLFWFKKLTENI